MSDASVLKEYLIALGFKVDDASFKKFQKGMAEVNKKAVALGEIIADASEKVAQGVLKMVQSLDTLYFTSRRVGDSTENISAFGFAISQMGGSAESATASLESLASKMRFTPGLINAMQGWGIKTTDAKGGVLGATDLLVNAGRFWKAQNDRLGMAAGQALGLRQAQLMGVDEKTYLQLSDNPEALAEQIRKYKEMADQLGYNVDAAHRFETSMRDLKMELGLFASVVTLKVMDSLQGLMDAIDKLFPGIIKFIGTKDGIQDFADIVIASMAALAVATIAATWPWLLLAAAIFGAIYAFQHWDEIVHPTAKKKAEAEKFAGDLWSTLKSGQIGKAVGMMKDRIGEVMGSDLGVPNAQANSPAVMLPRGRQSTVSDQVKAFFMANGYSEAQASGIVRGMFVAEGGGVDIKNPNSSAYGLGQWMKGTKKHPGRQADFKRVMGKDIHGSSLQDQLTFMLWEFNNTEKGARDAILGSGDEISAAIQYITKGMRPGAGTAGDIRRVLHGTGGRHVTMHHKTTIHVDGSKDPKATGAAVATAQERVWANALRGAKSALN